MWVVPRSSQTLTGCALKNLFLAELLQPFIGSWLTPTPATLVHLFTLILTSGTRGSDQFVSGLHGASTGTGVSGVLHSADATGGDRSVVVGLCCNTELNHHLSDYLTKSELS